MMFTSLKKKDTFMTPSYKKFKRLADKTLKAAKRSNNCTQMLRAIEIGLKIHNKEMNLKVSVDQLKQLKITELPAEVLQKWACELREWYAENASLAQQPPP